MNLLESLSASRTGSRPSYKDNMNKWIVFMVLISIFSACAFKKNPDLTPEQVQQKLDGRIMETSLKWEGQEAPITRTGTRFKIKSQGSWLSPDLVNLPVKVPDSIELNVKVAKAQASLKNLRVEGIATLADNLTERKVAIDLIDSSPSEIGTVIRFKINELHSLFKDDKEDRVSMQLMFILTSGERISLELNFCTPPSLISVDKLELTAMNKALKELSTSAKTLKLLQGFHLQNNSFTEIKISIPFHNRAKIHIPGKRYGINVKQDEANPHIPLSTQTEVEENHEIQGDFYLLPIKDDLVISWTGISQSDMDSIVLQPGESLDLGLYIDGMASTLLDTYPASQPVMKESSVGGYPTCPKEKIVQVPADNNMHFQYMTLCLSQLDPPIFLGASTPEEQQLLKDHADLCENGFVAMRSCIASSFSDRDICLKAALNDDGLYKKRRHGIQGHPFYSCRNNCGSYECTKPDWEWNLITSPFLVGMKTEQVNVEWETGNISIITRFVEDNAAEVTESRSIKLAPENMWIRN